MKETHRWGLIGFIAGAIGGWLVRAFSLPTGNEDRPPIVVRGGSLLFDTDAGWAEAGDEWKPDHEMGRAVRIFVAELRRVDGSVETIAATRLHIKHQHTFTLSVSGGEPRLGPKGLLRRSKDGKSVQFESPSSAIGELKALPSGGTYDVLQDEVVRIGFCYE